MSQVEKTSKQEKETESYEDLISTSFNHDINNLSNLADGYRELAENTENPQEHEEALKKAEEAENRIDSMYSKLESSQEKYETSLNEIIGESLQTLRPKIQREDKNVSVNWEYSGKDCQNCIMTERMIYNLLDNSLEHGTGDIELEVDHIDEYVELRMNDGGGLTEDEFNEIFCGEYEKDEYISTGSYVIDTIADKIDAEITFSDEIDYTVRIPLE